MNRRQIPVMLGIVVAIIVGGLVFYGMARDNNVTPTSQEEQSLEAIRNREDIKKQQELLVKETYLLEEKTRLESDIESIEAQLETVRSEKTSFQ